MAAGLDQLFRAHWKLVHGYLTRRTGDAVLAEELAQETFYRATRASLVWRGGSPSAWHLRTDPTLLPRRRARIETRLLDRAHHAPGAGSTVPGT